MADNKRHEQGGSPEAPAEALGTPDIFSTSEIRGETHARAERWRDLPPEPSDPELIALREQLFRREIAIINKLTLILDRGQYNASELSKVVSEAIVIRAAKDEHMVTALEPLVGSIVTNSMRLHRKDFVNAIFPLMGPSIRKSIAENFRSMMGSFSKSLEVSLSLKGLRWRFEAIRSGKPFSEIVLLHTLVYRVEQVFFIHSQTGLVLSHLVNEGVGSQDADMVSAMLTAIQDFVRDAFSDDQKGDLESLQMGEFTILIEKTPEAYLACVVRGVPPAGFRERLRNALDSLLVEYGPQLATFKGDNAPFHPAIRFLEEFMVSRYVDEDKPLPPWAKIIPAAIFVMLLLGIGTLKWQSYVTRQRLNAAVGQLRAEPGIIVTYVDRNKNLPWQVVAFKDDLARAPEKVLPDAWESARLEYRMIPFISYDQTIIERRVLENLSLPEGVSMTLADGVLTLAGDAPFDFILKVRDLAYSLPGIKRVNIEGLQDPRMAEMAAMIRVIEESTVEFPTAQAHPVKIDHQKLEKAVDTLVELETLASEMSLATSLTIYGHADTTGSEEGNYLISRARTQTVAAMLYARGSSMPIAMHGMGSKYPKGGAAPQSPKPDQSSRRIEMRVHLLQSMQPLGAISTK